MALGSEVKIISSLRKKTDNNTFEPMFLGPEQRYIGSLRASSNNNLEEQLLIGPDRIVSTWEDDLGEYGQYDFTSQEDIDETGASLDGNALVLELNSFCFVNKEGYVSTDNIYAIEQVNNDLNLASFGSTYVEFLEHIDPFYSNHYVLTKIKYKNGGIAPDDLQNSVFFNQNQVVFGPNTVEFDEKALQQLNYSNTFMRFIQNQLVLNSIIVLERELLQWRRENGTLINVAEKVVMKQAGVGNRIKWKESIINYLI